VYQLAHSGLVSEFPPLRSSNAGLNNLPLQRTRLVGQGTELASITRLFDAGNRVITLTGAGGCGKTRLALHVAADLSPDWGGVWWIDLATCADASLLPNAAAATLAIKEVPGERLPDTVARDVRHDSVKATSVFDHT